VADLHGKDARTEPLPKKKQRLVFIIDDAHDLPRLRIDIAGAADVLREQPELLLALFVLAALQSKCHETPRSFLVEACPFGEP